MRIYIEDSMPELPEVETIVYALRNGGRDGPRVAGLQVIGAQVLWERTIATPSPKEFKIHIIGQTIQDVSRRGKYIIFHLTDDKMIVHLRMSGDLLVETSSIPAATHHRLILDLEGGTRLSFNDTRKFGRVWLTDNPESVLGKLGPEPLDDSFTKEDLYRSLQSHRRRLKPLLLDQTFLAGMGNIYVDEALHMAKIHPLTRSDAINLDKAGRLWETIRAVLNEGITRSGASIDWVYRGGDFQNYFRVYQRTSEACPECGTLIERIVVSQRGTHYCPSCQPDPVVRS
jgi:formamidopyrimidine-DNA glycosylase